MPQIEMILEILISVMLINEVVNWDTEQISFAVANEQYQGTKELYNIAVASNTKKVVSSP